jgi:hypothetical protein
MVRFHAQLLNDEGIAAPGQKRLLLGGSRPRKNFVG